MIINIDSFVGKRVNNLISNICDKTFSKCLTNLNGNVEYIFFTGNDYDFYVDYKRQQTYVFALNGVTKEYLLKQLHDCEKDIDDLYTYLNWIKHSQSD